MRTVTTEKLLSDKRTDVLDFWRRGKPMTTKQLDKEMKSWKTGPGFKGKDTEKKLEKDILEFCVKV